MQTKFIGITIIVMGLIMMSYSAFNYQDAEKAIDHRIQYPPVIGLVIFLGGIIVVLSNKKSAYNLVVCFLL